MNKSAVGVTLFLTTYNWPEALKLCVKSIFLQSVLPNEIIIADDGSGEETRIIIDELKKESPVSIIHLWQTDEGYRINAVRNMAIVKSKHPYIIQIDGDLILHHHFVKDHLSFAKDNRFLIGRRYDLSNYLTGKLLGGEQGLSLPFAFRNKTVAYFHDLILYKKNSPRGVRGCNMSFWKKDAFKVNGYDEDMNSKGPDDKEFAVRLINVGVEGFNLKYYANCFHFFHNEDGLCTNHQFVKSIYHHSVATKKTSCKNGLVKKEI